MWWLLDIQPVEAEVAADVVTTGICTFTAHRAAQDFLLDGFCYDLIQRFSAGDELAVMADQFGQLAVSLADGADQPVTEQRLVEFAVRGIPGRWCCPNWRGCRTRASAR